MKRTLLTLPLALLAISACGSGTEIEPVSAPASASSAAEEAAAARAMADQIEQNRIAREKREEAEKKAAEEAEKATSFLNQPLGSSIVVTNEEGMNLQVTPAAQPKTSKKALSQYADAPEGTLFGVDILYSCVSGSCDYNPFDWNVRGADGVEYDRALFDSFEPELKSGDLTAGSKAKGYVTWDLPVGTYSLEYSTNAFSGEKATWVLTVA